MSVDKCFRESVAIIVAAMSPVGQALCVDIARAGGRIIAVDTDRDGLMALAGGFPDRIEPLVLDILDPDARHQLIDIWGPEPLDFLINLVPLDAAAGAGAVLDAAIDIMRGFTTALAVRRGMALHVMWQYMRNAAPDEAAIHGAMLALHASWHAQSLCTGARVCGLTVARGSRPSDAVAAMRLLAADQSGASNGVLVPVEAQIRGGSL